MNRGNSRRRRPVRTWSTGGLKIEAPGLHLAAAAGDAAAADRLAGTGHQATARRVCVPGARTARRPGCRAHGRSAAGARRQENGAAGISGAGRRDRAAASQCSSVSRGRTGTDRQAVRGFRHATRAPATADRYRKRLRQAPCARLYQPAKKFFILSIHDLARGLWFASSLRLMSSNSFRSSFCRLVRLTGVSTTTWHIRSPG